MQSCYTVYTSSWVGPARQTCPCVPDQLARARPGRPPYQTHLSKVKSKNISHDQVHVGTTLVSKAL